MSDCSRLETRNSIFAPALRLLIAITLISASGATCQQFARQYYQPRTLPPSATLSQIMTTVNDNTGRVQSLQSTQATLSVTGAPVNLRANVALQSPTRLRLRADGPLGSGPQLDLGSNDELFWLWVKENRPPAMFFCTHDRFAMSSARQIMPVEPEWLIEAVGLVRFDPNEAHEGPRPVGGGRVEIRSHRPSASGDLTRIVIVDEWDGTVLEQHLYDAGGQRIASALTSKYKRDPISGAALPHSIEVQWPTAQMSFHLDVNDWQVNAIPADNIALWAKPEYPGYPDIDLADPNLRFTLPANAAVPAAFIPPATSNVSAPTAVANGPVTNRQMANGPIASAPSPTVVYPAAAQYQGAIPAAAR